MAQAYKSALVLSNVRAYCLYALVKSGEAASLQLNDLRIDALITQHFSSSLLDGIMQPKRAPVAVEPLSGHV